MSYKRVEDVLDNGPADRTEELILVAIAENANDAGYGFPGVALIAHRARCGERHVLRLIKKIAVDGWLVTLPRAEGFGKKQTAFQLNLTKLASNVSHAAQIAHEKAKRDQKKQLRGDSHAAQIAHEKSGDISPHSQVTFEAVSGDISPLPILKNHEPSLEPSNDVAEAPVLSADKSAKVVTKSRAYTEDDVLAIWSMWPDKGGKQNGLVSIGKAISYLASMGTEEPATELKARVRTWLAWHGREVAKMREDRSYFAAPIGYAQGWFGDKQKRYQDDAAIPVPEPKLRLPDGEVVSQSAVEADGWEVMRGVG